MFTSRLAYANICTSIHYETGGSMTTKLKTFIIAVLWATILVGCGGPGNQDACNSARFRALGPSGSSRSASNFMVARSVRPRPATAPCVTRGRRGSGQRSHVGAVPHAKVPGRTQRYRPPVTRAPNSPARLRPPLPRTGVRGHRGGHHPARGRREFRLPLPLVPEQGSPAPGRPRA